MKNENRTYKCDNQPMMIMFDKESRADDAV